GISGARGSPPSGTGRVGLVTADLVMGGAGHDADGFPVDDQAEGVALRDDGDDLACVGHADLDALAGDLDAAPAGDPPLHGLAGIWQRVWPGQADSLEPVALAGRDGTRQGAPQHPVLGDDMHDLAVEADPGALPGQRGADLDDLVAQRDDPGG